MKLFSKDFKTKVFIKFLILIITISFSFTAIFINHQKRSLTDALIKEGLSLVKLLAYNLRLGVFSENPDFLKNPIEGVMQREGVLSVQVYTVDGRLLSSKENFQKADTEKQEKAIEISKMSNSPFYLEGRDRFAFWAPIISGDRELSKESLFYNTESFYKKGPIIGFARISVSKEILTKNFKSLLLKSLLIASIFLIIGCITAYFVAKNVTKPLNQLTEGVQAIEKGELALQIPFKTNDEIGRLAIAFNNMAESLKEREAELRSMASELSLIEERERRQIATYLHDHIGQTLAISKIKLGALRESLSSTDIAGSLDEIEELINQVIQQMRSLTFELSPPVLYELGFEPAVEWLTEQTREKHGILVDFKDDKQPKPMDDKVRIFLFQAIRELLMNIVKHSKANRAVVSICRDGNHLRIAVEDNGIGIDISMIDSPLCKKNKFGLFSIRERLKHFGGHIKIKSEIGHGTRIFLEAPLRTTENQRG
ncbi:MAG: HAMP domain-containing protein [Nitrospirota bacterium]